jgi:tRNA threonylcarbamoyladenosine biosynthesis protein TsaB
VAVIVGSEVLAERTIVAQDREASGGRSGRTETLMPAIAECMAEARVTRADVERLVCGGGPGSFTSLRIAASVAKGLAVSYGVDLYAISSLLLIVGGLEREPESGTYVALLDAMRTQYFAQRVLVETSGRLRQVGAPGIIDAADIAHAREHESNLRFIGPGQEIDADPHARGVARLMDELVEGGPVDIASWEPNYGRLAEAQVRWEAAHGRPLAG